MTVNSQFKETVEFPESKVLKYKTDIISFLLSPNVNHHI